MQGALMWLNLYGHKDVLGLYSKKIKLMILFKSNLTKVNKSQIEEPTVVVASGPIVYTSIVVTATKTTSEVWLSSNVNRVVEFNPKIF